MGIIEFIVIALILGVIVWLIQTYAPIPGQFKTIILWAAIIVLIVILLNALGIVGKDWQIPRLR